MLIESLHSALKLRYMLPIQMPSQLVATHEQSSPVTTASPSSAMKNQTSAAAREQPILFDAKVVAKKNEGWDDMLEDVLFSWMDKVVSERRVFH